jgi:hypothetical protein
VLALIETGERVRNTYATYLQQGNSPKKFGLILHNFTLRHLLVIKAPAVEDGHAVH